MAGLNIPGVTDQYKTNETIEKLMQIERIPLTREQKQLESYKADKEAWREISTSLSSLRDSTKTLYSFENPFNNKITTSTDENAVTAEAGRNAQIQSFKIDVIQPAAADRFLTDELDRNFKVPAGLYTYKVGDKQLSMNWKGGTLKDFSDAVNRRGNGIVKSMVIGASAGKKTLLLESLVTGKENRLLFENDAEKFAVETGMITPVTEKSGTFGTSSGEFSFRELTSAEDNGMPPLSAERTEHGGTGIHVSPRGAFTIKIPDETRKHEGSHIKFSVSKGTERDITETLNESAVQLELPSAGAARLRDAAVSNAQSVTLLAETAQPRAKLEPVKDDSVLFAVLGDGTEIPLDVSELARTGNQEFDIAISDYSGISAITFRNSNTAANFDVSVFSVYNPDEAAGYQPNHPVSTAGDAVIKYEGITITRPTNRIDDIVPDITLDIKEKTDKTATLAVKPDVEASKEALITFVGKYNQAVAKINILSQTKTDIVEELDYLSDEEKKKEMENLGRFQTDFSLTNMKSSMQSIVTSGYRASEDAAVTMLSQIGIATNAGGYSGTYSQSKLRGYLEIDEKKLDSALENNLDDIKKLFGYDTDGDLIIDSGIAFSLDRQLGAYTQTGGILALKTSNLDSKIKNSESKIARLESQMDEKEADLRYKYGQMEGSLNSLESQQNSISNFTRQQNNQR